MDLSPVIYSSLQEKLDVTVAYPVVYTMTPQTITLFVGSLFTKLHDKILTIMAEHGEGFIANDDAIGLSLCLMDGGVKLPAGMMVDICEDIIKKSRRVARYIMPLGSSVPNRGGLYYCKLYINMNQDEASLQA